MVEPQTGGLYFLYQQNYIKVTGNIAAPMNLGSFFFNLNLKKKRHILRALGGEDSYKYKYKMQEFLLLCWVFFLCGGCFGLFFFAMHDTSNAFRQGAVSSTDSSSVCPLLVLHCRNM